jgi:cytochrome c
MPFGEAGTLSADETYAIVAYILYSNDLVDEEFELSHENFADFDMYNATGFIIDDRPDLEYAQWRGAPCMENCKDEVQVTMRSVFLVETPPEGGSNSVMNHSRDEALPSFTADGPSFIPTSAPQPEASTTDAAEESTGDTDLVAAGEKAFKKCRACHKVGSGAKNGTGPHLNGLMGRTIGGLDDFKYSNVFQAAASEGKVWDEESLSAFLAKPKEYFKGTKMAFAGLKKADDIAAVIAYLEEAGK